MWSIKVFFCRSLKDSWRFRKKGTFIKTTVSVSIGLASKIYERLLSQGLIKTKEVWEKIKRANAELLKFQVVKLKKSISELS